MTPLAPPPPFMLTHKYQAMAMALPEGAPPVDVMETEYKLGQGEKLLQGAGVRMPHAMRPSDRR